jgi:hypothetical protein
MGGIRMAKIGIECDRCTKVVTVDEPKVAEFYNKFSEREDKQEAMFAAVFTTPDGTTHEVIFEYVCPKCVEAINGYLFKNIQMAKNTPKSAVKERKPRGPRKPKVTTPDVVPPPAATAAPMTATPPPATPPAVGSDYDDNDLFN